MEELYTLREVSRMIGVPTAALRKYCNESLIRQVKRKRSGYRLLNMEQILWAEELWYLERCGFTTEDRKMYARLARDGDETIPERKAMLETKRRNIWQKIEDLQEEISFIERKIELFDEVVKK